MNANRILFLNFHLANSGALGCVELPHDYVLACRFLSCSIIDRTYTLDLGFDCVVLDRIPAAATDGSTFAELCDEIGLELVAKAVRAKRSICVLWSGGIDSTTALIAVMKAAQAQGYSDRVRVLLSLNSVLEYPRFFLRHIKSKYQVQAIIQSISASLDPSDINVTGEHGDQLFGSHLLDPYVRRGFGEVDYKDILPFILVERLRGIRSAIRVQRYLEPVITAAPVPIHTLFDYLWWLNFALKWQEVTLRLPAFRGEQARLVYDSLNHFFRDERFQAWSIANASSRRTPIWARYKDVAKRYILEFTKDQEYYQHKEKEDSLRNVMVSPTTMTRYRVLMREDFSPVYSPDELG